MVERFRHNHGNDNGDGDGDNGGNSRKRRKIGHESDHESDHEEVSKVPTRPFKKRWPEDDIFPFLELPGGKYC
jgi:hypothetical protein